MGENQTEVVEPVLGAVVAGARFVKLEHAPSKETHYIEADDIVGIAPASFGCCLRLRSVAERADWLRYRVTPEALLDAIGAEVIDLLPPEREGEPGEPSAA